MQTEFKLHRAIMDHLKGRVRRGNEVFGCNPPFHHFFATTIYQGRNKEDGFFLKMIGVEAGISDIIAWYKTKDGLGCTFMEVKIVGSIQSSAQKKIQGICHSLGIKYVVVRTVEQAHRHFVNIGLTPMHNSIREPDLRSDEQKKLQAFNFYKKD